MLSRGVGCMSCATGRGLMKPNGALVPHDLHLPKVETSDREHDGGLTFIGTATVLVQRGTFTFLTDPNFLHGGDHAHLGHGLHSERLTEPAMSMNELPRLDFVSCRIITAITSIRSSSATSIGTCRSSRSRRVRRSCAGWGFGPSTRCEPGSR